MDVETKQKWQAEKYHLNSSVQQEAACHLINLLKLNGKERILDIGCGDGKITAAIASILTEGLIVGSDVSQEMIQFASERFLTPTKSNLSFILLDAQAIDYVDLFDLVFSSFALQWVLDIELVLKKINISLRQNGRIGFTIPLSISDELKTSLAFLIKKPQWRPYFDEFKLNYYFRDEHYYDQLLRKYGFRNTHFEHVEQKWIFSSREEFEQYTLMWLPHINALPEHLRDKFSKQLMDKYVELTPPFEDGKLRFVFDRIDIIARKDIACQSI